LTPSSSSPAAATTSLAMTARPSTQGSHQDSAGRIRHFVGNDHHGRGRNQARKFLFGHITEPGRRARTGGESGPHGADPLGLIRGGRAGNDQPQVAGVPWPKPRPRRPDLCRDRDIRPVVRSRPRPDWVNRRGRHRRPATPAEPEASRLVARTGWPDRRESESTSSVVATWPPMFYSGGGRTADRRWPTASDDR